MAAFGGENHLRFTEFDRQYNQQMKLNEWNEKPNQVRKRLWRSNEFKKKKEAMKRCLGTYSISNWYVD